MNIKNLAACLNRLSETDDVKMARVMAHNTFDKLWKSGHMSRSQAYAWLAFEMQLSKDQAHIAKFNVQQCRYIEYVCKEFLPGLYR
jgi:hypothetical protein